MFAQRSHRTWIGVVATMLAASGALAPASAQSLGAIMGGYWFPNPGTGGNPNFDQQFDQFKSSMGVAPHFRNTYCGDSNNLADVAHTQLWNVTPLQTDPRFANGAVTPVIGLPMAAITDSGNATKIAARFNAIAAGNYDIQWLGVVDAWRAGGFKKIEVRVGFEMNGHSMPWSVPGGSAVASWNAAFRHVSQTMKAEGTKVGTRVIIVWNASSVTWSNVSTPSQYPGDDVVDIMSLDLYSTVQWAGNFTNWNINGTAAGIAANLKAWAASPTNREHFWLYPDASASDPTGARQYGWGLAKHLAFAAAHKKPIAFSETGVGTNPAAPADGIDDDGRFPGFLWTQIHNYPYGIDHVDIWTLDQYDCHCNILTPTSDPHPLAKSAWRKYFGDGHG